MIQIDKNKCFEILKTDMVESAKYILKNAKGSLFRYRSFNKNNIDALKRKKIYLSAPENFNDPWECLLNPDTDFYLERAMRIISEHASKLDIGDELKLKFKNKVKDAANNNKKHQDYMYRCIEKNRGDFRIACFSETNDNILMWSHYADYHTGFCVEYDIKELMKYSELYNFIFPVNYTQTPLTYISNDIMNNGELASNMFFATITKSACWTYEQEWRLVLLKEYVKRNCIDILSPKHVYLGLKTSDENEREMLKIAQKQGFTVSRMKMKRDKYELYT